MPICKSASIVRVILLSEIIIDSIHNCFDQLCVITVMILMLYFVKPDRKTKGFNFHKQVRDCRLGFLWIVDFLLKVFKIVWMH